MVYVRREATKKVSVSAIKATRKSGNRVRDPKAEFIKRPFVTQSQETTVKAFQIRHSAVNNLDSKECACISQAILDSVSAHIAVLDSDGVITAVNDSWRRFAIENGTRAGVPSPNTDIGCNYLSVCQLAIRPRVLRKQALGSGWY